MKKIKETGQIPYIDTNSNDKGSYGDENTNEIYY
jgi:hypothetical protein